MALSDMETHVDLTGRALDSVHNAANIMRARQEGNPFYGMDLELLSQMAAIQGSSLMRSSAAEANRTNIRLAKEAQAFNAEQAQKQMDFQERMSNTAHQREMQDLIAAGLNPILTATGGNGASSPGGSSANAVMARVDPTVRSNPYENIASSTYSARRFKEIEKKQLNLSEKQYQLSMAELEIAQKQLQLQGISLDDALKNSASQRRMNATHSYLMSEQGKSYAKGNLLYPVYERGAELLNSLIEILMPKSESASFMEKVSTAVDKGKEALHELGVNAVDKGKKAIDKGKRFWDYITGKNIKDFSDVDVSKFRTNRNYGDEP